MNDLLERLLNHGPLTDGDVQWALAADPAEIDELLLQLTHALPDSADIGSLCRILSRRLADDRTAAAWRPGQQVAGLYDALSPDNPSRGAVLRLLLTDGGDEATLLAATRLNQDPPRSTTTVAQSLSVLFRNAERVPQAAQLIQLCWPAMEHIHVASPLLDLMNYLSRKHALEHPAADRTDRIRQLLSAIVARLDQMAKQPPENEQQRESHQAMVEEGVPLCVSLCDALALIGEDTSQAVLRQALELPHRRIRTEAAWGLAKLGDSDGERALLDQTRDAYTRLRALEYLQELELIGRVDPAHLSPASRAESALCSWLAEPSQFGLPPHALELVEQRSMYWPGFDEEQDCYLFRFTYRLPRGELVNLGISGPVEHAFATDLTRLDVEDVWAMFAGWHAEHEEMDDVIPEQLSPAGRLEMERLIRRLRDCGYADIEPMLFCQFFGDKALVAQATDEQHPDRGLGWAVADAVDDFWLPAIARFGPIEASYVYKGRRLLRNFNDQDLAQ